MDTNGKIVYRPEPKHRCQPPFSTEQFSEQFRIPQLDNLVAGTIWRCGCGRHWYVKGHGGYSTSAGRSWYLRWKVAGRRRLRKAGIDV